MNEQQKQIMTFKYNAHINTENNFYAKSKHINYTSRQHKRSQQNKYENHHIKSVQQADQLQIDSAEEQAVNILHDLSFSRDFEDINVKNLNSNLQQICKNNFDEYRKRKSPKKIQKVDKQFYCRKRPKSLQQARTERSQQQKSQNYHSISTKQLQMKFQDELQQAVKQKDSSNQLVCFNPAFNNFPGFAIQNSNNNLIYLKPKIDNKTMCRNAPNKQIKFMNLNRQNYSSPYEYNTQLFENSYIKKQKIFKLNPQQCKIDQNIVDTTKNNSEFQKYNPISSASSQKQKFATKTQENIVLDSALENMNFIDNSSHLSHLEYSQYTISNAEKTQRSSSPQQQQIPESLPNLMDKHNQNNALQPSNKNNIPQMMPSQTKLPKNGKKVIKKQQIHQTLYNNNIQSQFRQIEDQQVQQLFENLVSNNLYLAAKQTPFQQYQGRRGMIMSERKEYYQSRIGSVRNSTKENEQIKNGAKENCINSLRLRSASQQSHNNNENLNEQKNENIQTSQPKIISQDNEYLQNKHFSKTIESKSKFKKQEKENGKGCNNNNDKSISYQFYDDELRKKELQSELSVLSSRLNYKNGLKYCI